jgi:hypothetical protein
MAMDWPFLDLVHCGTISFSKPTASEIPKFLALRDVIRSALLAEGDELISVEKRLDDDGARVFHGASPLMRWFRMVGTSGGAVAKGVTATWFSLVWLIYSDAAAGR